MKCNHCGNEFGKGNVCQHCGTDKVTALGEFSGYSVPENKGNAQIAPAAPVSSSIPPYSSMICWKCGEVIPGDSKYCPVCQTQLFVICPQCGYKYSAKYHNCSQCGTNREDYMKAQELAALAKQLEEKKRRDEEEQKKKLEELRQKKMEELRQIKLEEERKIKIEEEQQKMRAKGKRIDMMDKQRARNYIEKMAVYLAGTPFLISNIERRLEIMDRYVSDHLLAHPLVNVIISAVIKDRLYWSGQNCLQAYNLSREIDRVCDSKRIYY